MKRYLERDATKILPLVLGIGIVGAIVFYVAESITLASVWKLLADAHRPTLGIFLVCSLSMALLRVWRYRVLLRASGHEARPLPLFFITLVRNLFADLLPAKMGTLAYVGLVTTRLKIPLPVAMGSWGYEYVLDVIALFPVILVAALIATGNLPLDGTMIVIASALAIGVAIVGVTLIPWAISWSRHLVGSHVQAKSPKIASFIASTEDCILDMRRGNVLIPAVLLSLAIRVLKYAGLYFVLVALLLPQGYSLEMIRPASVFFGFISAEFAAALPLPSLAGFGAYQGAWSFTFQLLGFSEVTAKSTSIAHHLFTQGYAYTLGAAAFILLITLPHRIPPSNPTHASLPRFLLLYSAAIVMICVAIGVSSAFILSP